MRIDAERLPSRARWTYFFIIRHILGSKYHIKSNKYNK